MTSYFADHAWLPHGWGSNARIDVDESAGRGGTLLAVDEDVGRGDARHLGRFVLPGMPNLHSHAFQRAMAGLAERRSFALVLDREAQKAGIHGRTSQQSGEDSFWTWRETMYAFASRIGPDDLRAIAAQLYVEMVKAGYTQVCEFHYLHHRPDGRPYDDPAAMSLALIEAAREAGIGLTLLPALYITGGFDGRPLSERQRRFGHDVHGYLRLLEHLRGLENSALRVGVALHSLRAVPEDAMNAVLATGSGTAGMPIHIHVAEQIGEVQDCLALRNARPIEWLLDHAPVDERWCLVHSTHMTTEETRRLASTGAVAGLCPTTEANLGDGVFPLALYLQEGGSIGVGSDSHISVSPVEELRWLEYGQRLTTRKRNIAVAESSNSVGETLWGDALFGGAQASGAMIGALEGADPQAPQLAARADLLVLDDEAPLLAARDAANVLDTFVFAGNVNLVRHVMVNGAWVVRDFRHRDEERIAARWRDVVSKLQAS